MVQTTAQILKMAGRLPGVPLADIGQDIVQAAVDGQDVPPPTCGHPQQADPELAHLDPEDEKTQDRVIKALGLEDPRTTKEERRDFAKGILQGHKRLMKMETASGRGSWPEGCHDNQDSPMEHQGRHAFTVYVDRGSFASHHKREVTEQELEGLLETKLWGTREEIWDRWAGKDILTITLDLCIEALRRAGVAMILVDKKGDSNVILQGRRIPGSTIGYAYFNDATCGDVVTCNIDNDYRTNLFGLARLVLHELGHNNNLQHTFSGQSRHKGIMSYTGTRLFYGFSTGKAPHVLPKDPAWTQLNRFYGTDQEIPLKDAPAPPPPPDGQDPVGTLTMTDGTVYDIYPKGVRPDPGDDVIDF